MLWFRHNKDMRHRPEMTYITRQLGVHGVVAAYRLLEVWCDLCGSGEKMSATLTLANARNMQWLANEILLPDGDDEREVDENGVPYPNRSLARLEQYLTEFEMAGLIEQGTAFGPGWNVVDGKKIVGDTLEFKTITLLAAEGLLDAWTSRYKGRGVGKQGHRSDLD
jgi:hypothetical protein